MEPISAAALAKWAGPKVSHLAVDRAGKLSRPWMVAWTASKRAASEGIGVTWKSVRTWLGRQDTAQQLQQCTERSLADTAAQLAFLISGNDPVRRQADALRVLQIVMEEYLRRAPASDAIVIANARTLQAMGDEGARTRAVVEDGRAAVLDRLDASGGFDSALATFSPWCGQAARDLLPTWPAVVRAVSVLHDASYARGAVVEQWVADQPDWLAGAPAQGLAWLGQVAADYDAAGAARFFFDQAVRQGGFPRDYLVARAALQAGPAVADETVRDYLEAHLVAGSRLHAALRAFLSKDWQRCLEQLTAWEPHDAGARVLKILIESESLLGSGEDGRALVVLRDADKDGVSSTSVPLRLAEVLLRRAAGGRTQTKLADAQEALAAAVRVRNGRRAWFGDSVAAMVVAVQAAQVGGDAAQAWRLTQPEPDGEALPQEARDVRLRDQTAVVAALTGRVGEAERFLPELGSAFVQAQVAALVASYRAEEAGEPEQSELVRVLWRRAWEAASTDGEQLTAVLGLLESGGELPDLGRLQAVFPEAVEEITLVARALTAGSGDELTLLRANVTRSAMIALKLAQRYELRGEPDLAGQTLRGGAQRWHDAQFMAMAAGCFWRARSILQARECARDALTMAGQGWAGEAAMHALLVEVESADGQWDRATESALRLVALDPSDPGARWALIRCHAARSMVEQAWQILAELGAPIDPRSREEAMLWVQLGARFSTDPQFTGRALTLMRRWPNDEVLLGVFLQSLMVVAPVEPLSEQDGEELRSAIEQYLEQFPDSSLLRAMPVGTGDDLLEGISEELRRSHNGFREVREKIHAGELPLGLYTLTGGTYAEACLRRAAGRVFASWFPANDLDARGVEASRSTRTVLDTSAAHTLALLDPEVVEELIGHAHDIITTDQLLGDALRARESLTRRSELALSFDERSNKAVPVAEADEDMALLRVRSARLVEIMQGVTQVPRPELRCFPVPEDHHQDWLTAIDYAKEHRLVLWCDDRVLRALAHTEGVAAFGTLDVLDSLQHSSALTADRGLAVKAELLRNYFVDLPFSHELHCAAAQVDQWRPRAVAAALTRPSAWFDPQATAQFALDTAARLIGTRPDEAGTWLHAACAGLGQAYPDSRAQNLKTFALQALSRPWTTTDSFPFVLAGLQAGTGTDGLGALTAALTDYYRALVSQFGHVGAADRFIGLFAHTREEDKVTAVGIVMRYREP